MACVGDFAVTFLIGFLDKDYDLLNQSESSLGSSNSPVAVYMNTWAWIFSLLFVISAIALRQTVFSKGRWQQIAVWLIVIYGIGEGIGSGLFPFDHIGNRLTLSGKLHSLFSGIGVAALAALPFVLRRIFPGKQFPKMNVFFLAVGLIGPLLIIMFILARAGVLPWRGLWQRLFILDYYSMLIVMCIHFLKRR